MLFGDAATAGSGGDVLADPVLFATPPKGLAAHSALVLLMILTRPDCAICCSIVFYFLLLTCIWRQIIELREDLRLAKATATHQADTMMHRTFKECSIGEVTEPARKFSAEEAIPRRPDGSRDVAPVLQSFLTDLGSWLFAKDVDRWAKQARKAQRIGASS